MLIVTSNDIPGYRVEAVLGEVMGMTVRAANVGANIVAGFRSLGGGEVDEYTRLVYDSRQQVMSRMWQDAVNRGANAIIAMRFDTGSIGQAFSEAVSYTHLDVYKRQPQASCSSSWHALAATQRFAEIWEDALREGRADDRLRRGRRRRSPEAEVTCSRTSRPHSNGCSICSVDS